MFEAKSKKKLRGESKTKPSKTIKNAKAAPKPTPTPTTVASPQLFPAPISVPPYARPTPVPSGTWNKVLERLTSPPEMAEELKTTDPHRIKEPSEKGSAYPVA